MYMRIAHCTVCNPSLYTSATFMHGRLCALLATWRRNMSKMHQGSTDGSTLVNRLTVVKVSLSDARFTIRSEHAQVRGEERVRSLSLMQDDMNTVVLPFQLHTRIPIRFEARR